LQLKLQLALGNNRIVVQFIVLEFCQVNMSWCS